MGKYIFNLEFEQTCAASLYFFLFALRLTHISLCIELNNSKNIDNEMSTVIFIRKMSMNAEKYLFRAECGSDKAHI